MTMLLALLTLAFAHPAIEPAKPGEMQPEGNYVVSAEGVFRLDRGKVQHLPKKFHPAFVFSMDGRFRMGRKPVEAGAVTIVSAAPEKLILRYSDGFLVRKGPAKILPGSSEIGPSQTIGIANGGDEYLLVQWLGKCESAFTLFLLDGDALKEVSTNSYGCKP